jgi:hypothetical protein
MKIWTAILGLLWAMSVHAQTKPPAAAAYVNSGGGFAPWSAALGSGASPTTPPAVSLYCSSDGVTWTPCTGSGGGPPTGTAGGVLSGTYPDPGLETQIQVINGVSYQAAYPQSTVDARANACLSDAVHLTNGNTTGVCDAHGDSGVLVTAGEIDAGDAAGDPYTWLLPANAVWEIGFSDTTKCGIRFYKNGTVRGDNNSINFRFVAASNYAGTGYKSVMCTDNTIGGYMDLENVLFENEGIVSASGHAVDIESLFDSAYIKDLGIVDHTAEIGLFTQGLCCGDTFVNLNVNCNYTAGCTPVVMNATTSGSSSEQQVTLISPSIDHPGATEHCLTIQDTRTPPASAVEIVGQYSEGSNSDTTTSCDYFNGVGRVDVLGFQYNYNDNASTASAVEINYSGSQILQITVTGLNIFNALTYPVVAAIKNDVTTTSYTSDAHGYVGHFDNSNNAYVGSTVLGNGSTATTQTTGDNTVDVATDAFVNASITAIAAPAWANVTAGTNTKTAAFSAAAPWTFTVAGAASTPAIHVTGTPSSGSATTSYPQFYVDWGSSQPTTFSTGGTVYGINTASSWTGDWVNFFVNGTTNYKVTQTASTVNENFAAARAQGGYDGTNYFLQGGTGHGVGLGYNNATFGSGYGALLDSSGNFGVGTQSSAATSDPFYVAVTTGFAHAPGLQSIGTKFTTSGCSVSATTGGATAGKLTVGANTCSVVITMNGATGLTASNGWSCKANDETTAAANSLLYFSTNNATTATLSVPSTAGTTDVIDFHCMAF